MDSQYSAFVSRDEFWRLQNDLKDVTTLQAEQSERISRLERRRDEDGRTRSIWGGNSPFPAPVGTPATEPSFNPAAEAFKNFDQDQSASMIGSLHLDAEDEPRRGTSRANSVRFDESALGHFGHNSRPSSDFFPVRSGSAFGNHPLVERSSSHKSDGRQSSTHSGRLNSLGSEGRASAITNSGPAGPPPGLFLLGPHPSIVRCWLDTTYSNDTLLYAGACTGSAKSILSLRLAEQIGQSSNIREVNGERRLQISVYLPEATITESSSRSASPAPALPSVTVDFYITEVMSQSASLEIVLGSDLLRMRNADILFSQDKLSMLDDDNNRLAVPLVRPENTATFESLITFSSTGTDIGKVPPASSVSKQAAVADKIDRQRQGGRDASTSELVASALQQSSKPILTADEKRFGSGRNLESLRSGTNDPDVGNGAMAEAPVRQDPATARSWRSDAPGPRDGTSFSSVASIGAQRGSRGKSMKVLKTSRSGGSRSVSGITIPAAIGPAGGVESGDVMTPRWPEINTASSSGGEEGVTPVSAGPQDTARVSTRRGNANPIGGASAFSWMGSTGQRPS